MFIKKMSLCRPLSKILMRSHAGLLSPLTKKYMSNYTNKLTQISMEKAAYNEALPGIINNLVNKSRISQRPELGTHLRKICDYNLMSGNNSLAIITMITYNMLENPEYFTEENQHLSKVLGWCLAMLHCSACLVDDIIDESKTRRGAPCWHLIDNIGNDAIYDAFLLTCCVTEIIEMYFSKTPQFTQILQLLHKTNMCIYMGQVEDSTIPKKRDYSLYTMNFYHYSNYYKTSSNSIQAPIELGMTLVSDACNKINTKQNAIYDNITSKLGKLFQMQNDYNDCFLEEDVTGKIGTDIIKGKCTWLAVTALQRCNKEQRQRFEKYFGNDDPEHVAHIKSLYNELNLPELYKQETTAIHNDIIRNIRALPSETVSKLFYKILDDLCLGSEVWGNIGIQIQ